MNSQTPNETLKVHTVDVDLKIFFKDGRTVDEPAQIAFAHESQISAAVDRLFARIWTVGFVQKDDLSEKLTSYNPAALEKVELTPSRVQVVGTDKMPFPQNQPNSGGGWRG